MEEFARYNIWNPKQPCQDEWLVVALHTLERSDIQPDFIEVIRETGGNQMDYLIKIWDRIAQHETLDGAEVVITDNHYFRILKAGPDDLLRRATKHEEFGVRPAAEPSWYPLTQHGEIDAIFIDTQKLRFHKTLDPTKVNLFGVIYTPNGAKKLLTHFKKDVPPKRIRGAWCYIPMLKSFDKDAMEELCNTLSLHSHTGETGISFRSHRHSLAKFQQK